ncbi:hypothetical protein HDU67_005910 [Dinochytrium kinnereticum]|nr:hypothetical protein HDU67_005910 [Dinochytrium kinnereticum]
MQHHQDQNAEHLNAVVRRIVAPPASGTFLATLVLAAETVPGLAYMLAKDGGLFKLRELNSIAGDAMTPFPLPPDGWVRGLKEEGKSLTSKEIFEASSKTSLESDNAVLYTFKDFHKAYLEKKTDPVEVSKAIIDRIRSSHSTNPLSDTTTAPPPPSSTLNHFTQVSAARILSQAESSRRRYEAGKPLSVLDGVPVAVKDEVDVEGYGTWVGSKFLGRDEGIKERDAETVRRLRAMGAIILGKTTMEELGWSVFSSNTFGGVPKNPHDSTRSCGGSSGGSGGAVAAGFCPIAIGCDGGGSVRIPSSFCGLFGLKPTHCRISPRGGYPIAHTVGVQGPMTASADDLAVAYLAMAGPDPECPHSLLQPAVHLPRSFLKPSMKGMRFGVFPAYNAQVENPAIAKSMDVLQRRLVEAGAELVEVGIPMLEEIRMAHAVVISSEIYNGVADHPRRRELTLANRLMSVVAGLNDGRDYIRANQVRTHLIRTLQRFFSPSHLNLQFLLTPSTAITAPVLPADAVLARGGWSNLPLLSDAMRYVFIANFAGIPAVTIPFGKDADGMPVGVQVMSEWWGESGLLEVAKWMEGVASEAGMVVGRGKGWIGDVL